MKGLAWRGFWWQLVCPFNLWIQTRTRSSTDRTAVSGTVDTGSIPVGCTTSKMLERLDLQGFGGAEEALRGLVGKPLKCEEMQAIEACNHYRTITASSRCHFIPGGFRGIAPSE